MNRTNQRLLSISRRPTNRAFTLLELLIVVAILTLLITLVIVGMKAVRGAANRANTMSALQQMVAGYTAYATDNGGRLMPGYVDTSLIGTAPNQLDIQAQLADGSPITIAASRSYAWRLAPYLDEAWDTYYADFRSKQLTSRLENAYTHVPGAPAIPQAQIDAATLEISEKMSIGMNAMFVGGDSAHGGAGMTAEHPWINLPDGNPNAWAVTNMSRVRNPTQLIAFAPVGRFDSWDADGLVVYDVPSGAAHEDGFPVVQPPWLPDGAGQFVNQQWQVGVGGTLSEPTSGALVTSSVAGGIAGAGLPNARWGTDAYPVVNLDGSTTTESLARLGVEMTRWTNFSLKELQDRGFSP